MLFVSNLLLHLEDVPQSARQALAAALQQPAEQRYDNLIEAATILHREVGLDCDDARELVGLEDCGCEPASDRI